MNPVVQIPKRRSRPADDHPFRYGRRYARRIGDNGEMWIEELPLALEDLLHPEEGDELVVTPGHAIDCRRIISGLERHLPPGKTVVVLDDCNVDLGLRGVRPLRPDIAVYEVPSLPPNYDRMGTFRQKPYRGVPLLFVEVTSDDTRPNDFTFKRSYYERAGVQQFVIVDRANPDDVVSLFGFQLGLNGFVPQQPDEEGRLWLRAFGLWLGVRDNRTVLFDSNGELPDYDELDRRLEEAKSRAETEAKRAAKEKRRAQKEKQRADLADVKIRELQAQLERLKNRLDE